MMHISVRFLHRFPLLVLCALLLPGVNLAQLPAGFVNGDALPDAPALAARGPFSVGVRTLTWVHTGQPDILHGKGSSVPVYDRPLTVEVWYPAKIADREKKLTAYTDYLGSASDSTRPLHAFTFPGRSARDAEPLRTGTPYPLVIVSHGYPGSRVLLTYLTENLASKGYVVIAIDHTESTHHDMAGFASTLLNRATDILFVLNKAGLVTCDSTRHFLYHLADPDNTGLVGYSMGGYGVLNAAGAGYSAALSGFFGTLTGGSTAMNGRLAGNDQFIASRDKRIKAVVAFAPWGMERGIWDSSGLQGLTVPTFFIAGSKDDVSGYEKGTKAIFEKATHADRYLLTYENARHNTAPNPPPPQTMEPGMKMNDYYHYAEPAWNERKINNINQHFVTVFLGICLQHQEYGSFLDIPEVAGAPNWKGFAPRSVTGITLTHLTPKR